MSLKSRQKVQFKTSGVVPLAWICGISCSTFHVMKFAPVLWELCHYTILAQIHHDQWGETNPQTSVCLEYHIYGSSHHTVNPTARWAKAPLSSRLSSLCFTPLRPKFNPRTGQRPHVWKVSSVTCRRSVVSSGYSGFLHQKTDFIIIISPPWYDPGCCGGVKPQ